MADNDATIGHLSEGHTALAARQDGQDERVTDLERTVQALTAELAAVRAALEKGVCVATVPKTGISLKP